ncbi:MAG: apolipoprotein N-acyltransferase [Phycisphaerae bacterium]|nr:apolipoprotein N-acyltransferase [Phycisphaerae bacterium]
MPGSEPARARVPGRGLAIALGLAHGILMALAFPPFGLWGMVFVAPLPLAVAGVMGHQWGWFERGRGRCGRWRGAGTLGLVSLGVLPLWAYECQWVLEISTAGYWPMVAVLASFAGAFVWVVSEAARRTGVPLALSLPMAWTAIEVFRGEVACTGFAWMLLGHPLIDAPVLFKSAGALGTYFVSFVAATPMGLVLGLVRARRVRGGMVRERECAAAAMVMVAAIAAVRNGASATGVAEPLRVAVVQTNVPQSNKLSWTPSDRLREMATVERLTRQAAATRPALIVWPETMFPGTTLEPEAVAVERAERLEYEVDRSLAPEGFIPTTEFHDRLMALQREVGVPIVVGALGVRGLRFEEREGRFGASFDAKHNSVYVVDGGAVVGRRYDKLELTPFGEMMPYVRMWPWLQRHVLAVAAGGMPFDLSEGAGPVALEVPRAGVRLATPICFEVTRARLCRRLVREARRGDGGVVLANLTNDGWFGGFDPARQQHLQTARWRCVELGVPMVRAANTGRSAFVDASGRVLGGLGPARAEGVLAGELMGARGETMYSRIGDVFGWACVVGAGVLVVVGRRKGTA